MLSAVLCFLGDNFVATLVLFLQPMVSGKKRGPAHGLDAAFGSPPSSLGCLLVDSK